MHLPSEGVGKVVVTLASAFVEVVVNLTVGIVLLEESDNLFQIFNRIHGFQLIVDEIGRLICIGFFTEGPPCNRIYHIAWNFLIHLSFTGVHLLLSDSWAGE